MDRIQRALEIARSRRYDAAPELPRDTAPTEHAPRVASSVDVDALLRSAQPRRVDFSAFESRRVVPPDDRGPAGHAYRMMKSTLLLKLRGTSIRTIGVVSAAAGDGKSLTAVNLALSLASDSNRSIVLVDLDLRNPSVMSLLGLPAERGIESWYNGSASLQDVCYSIEGIDRLAVIPALRPIPGSADLIAGRRTADLFAGLRSTAAERLVIVDLPPALLANDFLAALPLLDGVIVVAAEGRSRREDLQRMSEMLRPARLLGHVVNLSSESESRVY